MSANQAIGWFVNFLRLVLTLHMPLKRSRIKLFMADLALGLNVVDIEQVSLLLVLEHNFIADTALNLVVLQVICGHCLFVLFLRNKEMFRLVCGGSFVLKILCRRGAAVGVVDSVLFLVGAGIRVY